MMKHLLTFAVALLATVAGWAANTTQTLKQVSAAIDLTTDVDLHITSTEPFTTTGSINITNIEHAVIIFEKLRPSKVAKQLGFITINGAAAVEGANCQLRLYGQGTILYPYRRESSAASGFHPLAVYSDTNCKGDTCELFGLEHSGGFMNTLTTAKLKKQIRSFRLKRGYMVTFSIQAEGRGYSRCFIADKADLVVNTLPKILDQRICSYRVFRWSDPGKIGVADIVDENGLGKLNATWSYTWGNGRSLGTDYECVPHMNHRWGPSAASLGSADYSCHIKTDNEPGNSADPEPATVDQVLDRWEDLMRTGKRLMTPSSHDGSMNWFRAFLDSIDARGWRCEILDFHCYWTEGQYNNLQGWADSYKRPIWITEFVWGASWNNNGAFANGVTEAQNKDVMSRIWTNLNNWNWIERYAYWNGERDPSRILKNGSLTPAGQFFANMTTSPGYKDYGGYVPKAPPVKAPSGLTVSFNRKTNTASFSWTNNNNGLTDLSILQQKVSKTQWVNIDTINSESKELTYSMKLDPNDAIGLNTFRILDIAYNNTKKYSNEASFFIGGAQTFGDVMAGRIEATNNEETTISFAKQDAKPIVITGMPTNANRDYTFTNHVTTIGTDNFKFYLDPWTIKNTGTLTNPETVDFLVMQPGIYEWGNMRAVVDTCTYINSKGNRSTLSQGDTIEVFFKEPFDEGVKPIVLAQNLLSTKNAVPSTPKILDVTNKGFKMKLVYQAGVTGSLRSQASYYIAITPGEAALGDSGKKIYAGLGTSAVGGTSNTGVANHFLTPAGDTLLFSNPFIIANQQTHKLDVASIIRKSSDITRTITDEEGNRKNLIYGIRVRRQVDPSATIPTGQNTADKSGDTIGWIVIDDDSEAANSIPAIKSKSTEKQLFVKTVGRRIQPNDSRARIFDVSGREVPTDSPLSAGIYLVTNGRQSVKVSIR